MNEHPIEGLMTTAMNSIQDMIDVNTIIGEPIETSNNVIIIPISKVSFGFAAGKVIVDGVLSMSYYKNTGGFMGKPQSMMSLIITDLVIIALIIRFIMLQSENMNLLTKVSLSMIIAGGISNLADRIFLGGIIDYIDFTMLNSNLPILNLSDVYEILGFVLFAVSMAIYTHSEIKKKKDKKKEIKEEV